MNTDEDPPPYAACESEEYPQVASDNKSSTELEMLEKELEIKKMEMKILALKNGNKENKKEKEDYQKKIIKFNNNNNYINEKIKSQIKEIIIKINKYASSPNQVQLYLNLLDKNDITILGKEKKFDTYDEYRPHIIKTFGDWEECTINTFALKDDDIQYSVTGEDQIECQYRWNYKERLNCCCTMVWCVFCPCTMMPLLLPFCFENGRESRFTTLRFNIKELSDASINPRRMNFDIKEYDIKICYMEGFF
jgi:hypothetical protein